MRALVSMETHRELHCAGGMPDRIGAAIGRRPRIIVLEDALALRLFLARVALLDAQLVAGHLVGVIMEAGLVDDLLNCQLHAFSPRFRLCRARNTAY